MECPQHISSVRYLADLLSIIPNSNGGFVIFRGPQREFLTLTSAAELSEWLTKNWQSNQKDYELRKSREAAKRPSIDFSLDFELDLDLG